MGNSKTMHRETELNFTTPSPNTQYTLYIGYIKQHAQII